MRGYSGEFIASLLIALVLSWAASLVIAHRYRSAMRRLMKDGPTRAATLERPAVMPGVPSSAGEVRLLDNRRAGRRLTVMMVAVSRAC